MFFGHLLVYGGAHDDADVIERLSKNSDLVAAFGLDARVVSALGKVLRPLYQSFKKGWLSFWRL